MYDYHVGEVFKKLEALNQDNQDNQDNAEHLKRELAKEMGKKPQDYEGIYGHYWYLEDALGKDLQNNNFTVNKIPQAFRDAHF